MRFFASLRMTARSIELSHGTNGLLERWSVTVAVVWEKFATLIERRYKKALATARPFFWMSGSAARLGSGRRTQRQHLFLPAFAQAK
jgi:hypothetical protein